MNTEKTINLILKKLETWYETILLNLPNMILAVIIVIAFALIAKSSRRFTTKLFLGRLNNPALTNLLGSIFYIFFLFLGVFIALTLLHLDKTVTSLLAGAGVIGLALGFAFQEIASNFVSGVFISLQRPYSIGDIVEIDSFFGTVETISLRTTTVLTFDGIKILIPNKKMFTEPLKNYNDVPKRRLDIEVGVAYNTDLEKAEKITRESLEDLPGRIKEHEVEVFYKGFGGSSINFDARVWIEYPAQKNFLELQHKAIIRIKKAFDEHNINIPFPIRTLDMNEKTMSFLKSSFSNASNQNNSDKDV